MALSKVEGLRCLPAGGLPAFGGARGYQGGQALAPPCGVSLHTPQSSLLGALHLMPSW
jgi:hypothetical protein